MIEKVVAYDGQSLRYYQKGENPKLLIYSGTHGDEAGVIGSVQRHLERNEQKLPDFVWVPEVSPSAVRLGTRQNERGRDVNRICTVEATDPEVVLNRMVVDGKQFDLFIDFHEDPTTDAFYLYDSIDVRRTAALEKLYTDIQELGVPLYHGLDDEELGLHVDTGYVVCTEYDSAPELGNIYTTWRYLKDHDIVRGRFLNPEVPGKVSQGVKDTVTALLFTYLQNQ